MKSPNRTLCRLSLLAAVLGLCVPAAATPAFAKSEAEPVSFESAEGDLADLQRTRKNRKAINDEIIQYLDLVAAAYANIASPVAPAEDAAEDVKKAHKATMKKHDKRLDGFREDVHKEVFRAFTLVKLNGETNIRDDVNIKAAEVLGSFASAYPQVDDEDQAKANRKAREKLSKKLRGELDRLHKAKYQLNTDMLDAGFAALASLNSEASLTWILDDYAHAKSNESEWLVSAHKGMLGFKAMPGRLRYEIVAEFIKTYAGVEAAANTSSGDPKDQAKKRFWDDIKTQTIPVVQYYAGSPADEDGTAYATMQELQSWFRDHKNPKRAPWKDEKPAKS